jgi:hypothetical protein
MGLPIWALTVGTLLVLFASVWVFALRRWSAARGRL